MDVFQMTFEVVLIADEMFPITRLPDTSPTSTDSRRTDRLFATARLEPSFRELFLDESPPQRVTVVASGKRPDCMKMLGEKDDRVDLKRPPLLAYREGVVEDRPGFGSGQNPGATLGYDREEVGTTGGEVAAIG